MLRAGDPCSVAWGAYMAGKYQLAACGRDLRASLVALGKNPSKEQTIAALAILDAMIQTKAFVLGEELEPWLGRDCVESAFVLLARRPSANRKLLLQLFRGHAPSALWLACGNLLAALEDQEFVLDLLRLPIALEVDVADPESFDVIGPFGGWGTKLRPRPPKGYPPIWFYRLGPGGTVVADGTRPVGAERNQDASDCNSIGGNIYRGVRREWLDKLLGSDAPEELLEFEHRIKIEWTVPEAFLLGIQQRRDGIGRGHRDLVAACVKAKLVTAAAVVDIAPVVETRVTDRRSDRQVPLPEPAASAKK